MLTVMVTGWVVSPEFLVRVQSAVPIGPFAVREGHPLSTGEGGFESLMDRQFEAAALRALMTTAEFQWHLKTLSARIPLGYEPRDR